MKVFETKDGFLVRLMKGEEILSSLVELARERELRGGVVHGIGAVTDTEIGYFRPDLKDYERFEVPQVAELTSMNGNFCTLEGKPFLHAHVTLLRPDRTAVGGHLFRSTIAVTGEFFVNATDLRLTRVLDPDIGLALLEAE